MEDERMQHPLPRVPHVDTQPLLEGAGNRPDVPIVLLNAFRSLRVDQAATLASAGNVYFKIAMLEGVGGIGKLLQKVPIDRVLFGSHTPLFHFESALGKIRESALRGPIKKGLSADNARRWLAYA